MTSREASSKGKRKNGKFHSIKPIASSINSRFWRGGGGAGERKKKNAIRMTFLRQHYNGAFKDGNTVWVVDRWEQFLQRLKKRHSTSFELHFKIKICWDDNQIVRFMIFQAFEIIAIFLTTEEIYLWNWLPKFKCLYAVKLRFTVTIDATGILVINRGWRYFKNCINITWKYVQSQKWR